MENPEIRLQQRSPGFWQHWMLDHSLGDLVMMGGVAGIGRLLLINYSKTIVAHHGGKFSWLVWLVAGVVEGLLIGYIEWRSIRKLIRLAPGAWISLTVIAAVGGWLAILSPAIMSISLLSRFTDVHRTYFAIYAAIAGMSFGTLVGAAQYTVVRKSFKNAVFWIFANAMAWMFSLIIIYSGIAFFGSSSFTNILITVGTCILSGLIQGLITGLCLHYAMPMRSKSVV